MILRKRLQCFALAVVFAQTAIAEDIVNVVMQTGEGAIEIELYLEKAPVTAQNFLRLVDGGHLDGAAFYRTVRYETDNGTPKIEVIQGGIGDRQSPFPPIAHETTEASGVLHLDGVVSMARGDVGTATTEFFICIGDQPALDFGQPRSPDEQGFAAFGKVVAGMDIVRKINALPADAPTESAYARGQILTVPVPIESIRRK